MDIVDWIVGRYELTHRLGNWDARGLEPALEGVTAETAKWRPTPDQHTIAEIVAHAAAFRGLTADQLLEPQDRSWLSP